MSEVIVIDATMCCGGGLGTGMLIQRV